MKTLKIIFIIFSLSITTLNADTVVQLKNGVLVSSDLVINTFKELKKLQTNPELLQYLAQRCKYPRPFLIQKNFERALKPSFIARSGQISNEIRNIVLCSIKTGGAIVQLVNPFKKLAHHHYQEKIS